MLDLFCRVAVPDIIWSDGGSQFTSSRFQAFLKDWGVCHNISSPHSPQSNEKAESTIKSMKKLIKAAWRRRSIDQDVLSRSSCSTGTHPVEEMEGHQHRSFMDIQFKTPFPHTGGPLLRNGNVLSTLNTPMMSSRKPSPSIINMLTHFQTWRSCCCTEPCFQGLGHLWCCHHHQSTL